ncbi:hypothetical protein EDD86DRAFT_253058 [Gorgonomyces haynaldii]|nr:hypothetical protein EDD86DRAFT_253058 [Gorgonomyces haynaldii]
MGYSALGYYVDSLPFEGTLLFVLSFVFSVIVLLGNLCVVVYTILSKNVNQFRQYLKVAASLNVLYIIFSLLSHYGDFPAILDWLFVWVGHLSVLALFQTELAIFARFVNVASVMMNGRLTERHLLYFRITGVVFYILCCGCQYVLLFKLGDPVFAVFWVLFCELSFIGMSIYRLVIINSFIKRIKSKDEKHNQLRHSVTKLAFFVGLVSLIDIIGACFFVSAFMIADTTKQAYVFMIANALGSVHPITLLGVSHHMGITTMGVYQQVVSLSPDKLYPLVVVSFSFDILSTLSNVVVIAYLGLNWKSRREFSKYLAFCSILNILYKICYMAFIYSEQPTPIHYLYVLVGYIAIMSMGWMQLEIFKRFLNAAQLLMHSKMGPKHALGFQVIYCISYIVLCGNIYVIGFTGSIGNPANQKSYIAVWWTYGPVLFVAMSVGLALLMCTYQILLTRQLTVRIIYGAESVETDVASMKAQFKRLIYSNATLIAVDASAALYFIISFLNPATEWDRSLQLAIGNSLSAFHPIILLWTTGELKVLLVQSMSQRSKVNETNMHDMLSTSRSQKVNISLDKGP